MPKGKLDTGLIVKTSVAWMVVAYLVCAAGFLVLPAGTFEILWKPMFHAFAMQPTGLYIIVGLVEAVVYTAFLVWVFVVLYNYFAKSKR